MPDSVAALAALGVRVPEEESGVFQGIRFVEDGRSVEARFPSGEGRGVKRTVLHDLLLRRAEEMGVSFQWGTQVQGVRDGVVRVGGEEIRAEWVVGADGIHSRIREGAGLGRGRRLSRRIGLRRHYRVRPWSGFMEVHWSDRGQAYVTPVGPEEVCVAVVGRERFRSVDTSLECFPGLAERLRGAKQLGVERGALTVGQLYDRVTKGRTALVGDASGSVDAVTGQGLALAFLQADALGRALKSGHLRDYEEAHRRIRRVPVFMSQSMLLMDRFAMVRRWSQGVFAANPRIFERMLAVHVGATPLTVWGRGGMLNTGLQMLMGEGA